MALAAEGRSPRIAEASLEILLVPESSKKLPGGGFSSRRQAPMPFSTSERLRVELRSVSEPMCCTKRTAQVRPTECARMKL